MVKKNPAPNAIPSNERRTMNQEVHLQHAERMARKFWAEAVRMAARAGWYPFGSHIDQPDVRLEFDGEDESGEPIWERPI